MRRRETLGTSCFLARGIAVCFAAVHCISGCSDSAPTRGVDNPESRRFAESLPGLHSPEVLVLYSIDGRELPDETTASKDTFHGYPVLGKLDIKQPASRADIGAAIRDGVAQFDGVVADCFWPRHGIQVVENGVPVDYAICFECLQFKQYTKEQGGKDQQSEGATTASPQSVLDRYLEAAGIPLAPK
jgi:hypothetical protein